MRWIYGALVLTAATAAYAVAHADPPPARPQRAMGPRVARPTVPSGYFNEVRWLHTPEKGRTAPLDVNGRPELVLYQINTKESEAFQAANDDGGFALVDLPRAAHVMREPSTGHEFPVERTLLDALYKIQRNFNAQELRIISAYRTPVEGNGQGNHGRGRACDFVVPGADDAEVARFAHTLGFVGVGIYPIGSFLHVDVRDRSYFWSDRSGPQHQSRERGILLDVAIHSDNLARSRGDEPPPPFVKPTHSTATSVAIEDEE
jgi:uncharacterized protein YcbK (DUF882 family)